MEIEEQTARGWPPDNKSRRTGEENNMSELRARVQLMRDLAAERLRERESEILRTAPDSEAAQQIRDHRGAGHLTTQN